MAGRYHIGIDPGTGQYTWRSTSATGEVRSGMAATRDQALVAARSSIGLNVGSTYRPAGSTEAMRRYGVEPGLVQQILNNRTIPGLSLHTARITGRAADALARSGRNPVAIGVSIDLDKLSTVLRRASTEIRGPAIARAINDTMDRYWTQLKALLLDWTGMKGNIGKGRLDRVKSIRRAHAGNLVSTLTIKDRYIPITARYFGATWNRSMPGVAHAAWGKQQTTRGSFMIPGKKPAFLRVTNSQFPIRPVWGPNPAREVERNKRLAERLLEQMRDQHLVPRLVHHVERAFQAAAAGANSRTPARGRRTVH